MSIKYEQVDEYGLIILEIGRALSILEGMSAIRNDIQKLHYNMPAEEIKRRRNEVIEHADDMYMQAYTDPEWREAQNKFLKVLNANE